MAKETSKNIEEEIDLLALFESLWKERVLIVVISVIITLFGLGSTFVIPPTYEAEVKLLPPSILDIVELKKFDAHENEPRNKPTPTEIFTEFLGTLKSKQLQQKFLEQEGVMKYLFEKDITQVKALDLFDRMIGIHESNIKTNGFSFKMQFKDADLATKFANQFIENGINEYRLYLTNLFNLEKDYKIKELELKKKSLINSNTLSLNSEISKLKQAYVIAEKLNIIEPPESTEKNFKSFNYHTEEMRYFYSQGTRALNLEIETLNKNKEEVFPEGLAQINSKLKFMNSLSFDATKFSPVKIDLPAEYSVEIKPKRSLILIVSAFVGGFLAITFVLARKWVRNLRLHT